MAARTVAATATIEQLRTTFNSLSETDFGDISQLSATITASNLVAAINELESEVTPFSATFISDQTDLGGAPATTDTFIINDSGSLKEMTVANLFTSPTINTINASTFTLDASADVNIDAGGGDIVLKDDGTTFGSLTNTSGNLIIKSGTTTAMTMSGANVTIAGNLTVSGTTTTVDSTTVNIQNAFVFEGSTDDSFETTLTTVDPTADRTISLPNATGTIVLKDTTDTLTNKTLTSPTINTSVSGTAIKDEDDMSSNSATALATQQSIKAFVTSGTVTMTNKTLTSPTISNPSFTGTTNSAGAIVFEGATADSFETTLTVEDPTADRTITIPNATTTLVGTDTSQTLTNKTLTGPSIDVINRTNDTITIAAAGAAGDIILDADGETIFFKDNGTEIGKFDLGSQNISFNVTQQDKDLQFRGNDGGSGILALTLDMSDAGKALFNAGGTFNDVLEVKRGATSAGQIKFFEDSDNGTNAVTLQGPASTGDITVTLPTQAGTVVVSNTTDGNDVQLDSLGLNTAASGTAGELRATNDITAFYSSDATLKENINEIPSALDMVDKLRGVYFDWKDDYIESKGGEDGYFMRKHDVGLIAQEVEEVLPEVVGTREDGIKAIKYDRIVPLLIQAIKELKAKIK